ncbi:MAG: hypothetical protein HY918_06230 [Candidatus Doudnabacteria bacterium]|nr:hypothetical protein [Candidatus Doudnabacteria bacterium]
MGYHWTVKSWLSEQGLCGHEFSIVVDVKFLAAARSVEVCQNEAQAVVRLLADKAGYRIMPHDMFLTFGEYGIEQIRLPEGGGKWLSLSRVSIGIKGAAYETYNIDHSSQQSFLMAVWLWWAGYVEQDIQD